MARRAGFVEIVDGVVQLESDAAVVGHSPFGGGIGVLATRDLAAGDIVLVEPAPLVAAEKSTREPLHMQLAKRVLQDGDRNILLEQMAVIYPRSLDEVDAEVLARARSEYSRSVQKLLAAQSECEGDGRRALSEEEMLGLVLKIAFSSFMGGIYVAGAMFNHSCRPNLICQPRPHGAPGTCMMATRAVASGEELTFSYLSPVEQSFKQRAHKFAFQHLCTLAPSPWPAEMEAFSARLEAELAGAGAEAERVRGGGGGGGEHGGEDEELTRDEAEGHVCHLQDVLDSLEENEASKDFDAKAFLQEVLEVKEEAAGLLNARHIVLCRLNNMAVRAAHQLLSARPHQQWALLMLQCSEELSATWSPALLGPDHCDLARIAHDKHVALDFLINNSPEALYSAFPQQYGTWQKASKAELAEKREAARIAALYDHGTPETTSKS